MGLPRTHTRGVRSQSALEWMHSHALAPENEGDISTVGRRWRPRLSIRIPHESLGCSSLVKSAVGLGYNRA